MGWEAPLYSGLIAIWPSASNLSNIQTYVLLPENWKRGCHRDQFGDLCFFLYMWKIYVLWVTNWISFYTLTILHLPVHYVHFTPRNEVSGGYIGFTLSVCLSVCPSVRLSVCLSVNLSCPPCSIYSSGRFFPYLVQMINSMRGCVACDEPWPWPISSRSFGLDLENRVRSVSSIVLDGFFLYFA